MQVSRDVGLRHLRPFHERTNAELPRLEGMEQSKPIRLAEESKARGDEAQGFIGKLVDEGTGGWRHGSERLLAVSRRELPGGVPEYRGLPSVAGAGANGGTDSGRSI